jgi:hypothetical protein
MLFALLIAGTAAGCTSPLPVEGAPCPCPEGGGYRCDPSLNRCVRAGQTERDGGTATPEASPDPEVTTCVKPGPTTVRRLDGEEYGNTVLDLLGVVVDTKDLPREIYLPDPAGAPASSPFLSPELAAVYTKAADEAAAKAVANLRPLLPCEPDPPGQNACARKFAEGFGARAYRRPLVADEIDHLIGVFDEARRGYGGDLGYRRLIQQVLASSKFYLRTEIGEASGPRAGLRSLTSWEIASRLSYFLWATTPDETLRARAAAGGLRTKADVRAQAERLLASPRAEAVVSAFHRRWLRLEEVLTVEKDGDTPAFSPALRQALVTSGLRTASLHMWQRGGDQAALFGGPVIGNRAMSDFYGLSTPSGTGFEELSPLGEQKRFGILTLPAVLSAHSKGDESAPLRRGHFVMDEFLCRTLPAPPASIPAIPEPQPTLTTRGRFAALTGMPGCIPCHSQFDPVGFGLENYDGYGRWRTTENGMAIDASGSGELLGRPFDGPGGLAALLAGSDEVSACLAAQWFRFAVGRATIDTDACTLKELERAFVAGGRRLRPLLLAITTTDAFLTREAP